MNGQEALTDRQLEIVGEIQEALKNLGADIRLHGVVGSWGDTLEEADVLILLKRWNQNHL